MDSGSGRDKRLWRTSLVEEDQRWPDRLLPCGRAMRTSRTAHAFSAGSIAMTPEKLAEIIVDGVLAAFDVSKDGLGIGRVSA